MIFIILDIISFLANAALLIVSVGIVVFIAGLVLACKKDRHAAPISLKNKDTTNTSDNPSRTVKIDINSIGKHTKGTIIEDDIAEKVTKAILNGDSFIEIPEWRLDGMERYRLEQVEKDKRLSNCCALNNIGMAHEKLKKIKLAVNTYEKNILHGCYPAHHSFKRLMILYRKDKDFDNEIRVIERALEVFPNEIEYIERLDKATELLDKTLN